MLPPLTLNTTPTVAPETPVTLPDIRDDVETMVSDWDRWLRFVDRETTLMAILGLVVFVVIFLIRKPLAHAVLNLVIRLRQKPLEPQSHTIHRRFTPALGWLITGGVGLLILKFIRLPGSFESLLTQILQTVALVAFFVLAYHTTHLIGRRLARRDMHAALNRNASRYLGTIIRAIIVVIGTVTVLSLWFPNITGVIAGVGIGGLLLALAAQYTAANKFAGIAIMLDHPFRIGDWIDTEDASGTVEAIGLRSTRLRAVDRSLITIPNSALGSKPIVNGTTRNARQIVTTLYVSETLPADRLSAWVDELRERIPQCPGVHRDTSAVHIHSLTPKGLALRVAFATDADFDAMLATRQAVFLDIVESAQRHDILFAHTAVVETDD